MGMFTKSAVKSTVERSVVWQTRLTKPGTT